MGGPRLIYDDDHKARTVSKVEQQKTEGGQNKVIVSDDSVLGCLVNILKEIKKMNFQLALITDTLIENSDMEM